MQLSVFGKWYFFGAHSKSPNTTKIGVSADTGENPKWHFWLQKCHFGISLEKGFYYLWCLKAVFCWKHYFYSAFSKTQLCRHERMQLEQKQKFTKNRGCLPKCKKVFFWYVFFFFAFWWFCFLLLVFWFLCFVKKAHKGYFPAILDVFCLFCSHKRPVLRCLFSSYFVSFAFVFPFKTPFYPFAFWPSAPFLENINIFGFFLFLFLAFSFLNVCLFLSNKLS